MVWLASRGASIYIPVGHSPNYDVVAEVEGELVRVQVKTSTFFGVVLWDFLPSLLQPLATRASATPTAVTAARVL